MCQSLNRQPPPNGLSGGARTTQHVLPTLEIHEYLLTFHFAHAQRATKKKKKAISSDEDDDIVDDDSDSDFC